MVLLTDRRVERTKVALRDALLSLLVTKGWEDVNIVDICELANVGRSTFYLHFQCKEDLLQSGLDNLRGILSMSGSVVSPSAGLFLPFLRDLIAHVLDHRDLCRCVVGRRSGYIVRSRFRDMIYGLVDQAISSRVASESWRNDLLKNMLTGAIFDLLAWLPDCPKDLSAHEVEYEFRRTMLVSVPTS